MGFWCRPGKVFSTYPSLKKVSTAFSRLCKHLFPQSCWVNGILTLEGSEISVLSKFLEWHENEAQVEIIRRKSEAQADVEEIVVTNEEEGTDEGQDRVPDQIDVVTGGTMTVVETGVDLEEAKGVERLLATNVREELAQAQAALVDLAKQFKWFKL